MNEQKTQTLNTNTTPANMTGPVNIESGTNTIGQLDDLLAKSRTDRNISAGKYLFFSLLLPPITLYIALIFAWQKRHFYVVLPNFTFVYSLITFLTAIIGLFPAKVPAQYAQTASTIDTVPVDIGTKVLLFLTIVLSLVGTVFGFALWRRAKNTNTLDNKLLRFLFILLNVEVLLVIYLLYREFTALSSTVSPLMNSGYPGL